MWRKTCIFSNLKVVNVLLKTKAGKSKEKIKRFLWPAMSQSSEFSVLWKFELLTKMVECPAVKMAAVRPQRTRLSWRGTKFTTNPLNLTCKTQYRRDEEKKRKTSHCDLCFCLFFCIIRRGQETRDLETFYLQPNYRSVLLTKPVENWLNVIQRISMRKNYSNPKISKFILKVEK